MRDNSREILRWYFSTSNSKRPLVAQLDAAHQLQIGVALAHRDTPNSSNKTFSGIVTVARWISSRVR